MQPGTALPPFMNLTFFYRLLYLSMVDVDVLVHYSSHKIIENADIFLSNMHMPSFFMFVGVSSASISQNPSAITARPGNMVILTCEATGIPAPTIMWRRNGEDVTALDDDRFIASEDGTLTILDSKVSDSGPYVCVADNNVGEPDTATFEIKVAGERKYCIHL